MSDSAPRVKVCGLTDPDEARACALLGVWAIGVVLAEESPRHVGLERAAEVLAALPRGVARVGVFVDPSPERMADAARICGLTHLQVHGGADPAGAATRAGLPVIAAVGVDGPSALERARSSPADLVLLDAAVRGRHGGTGVSFDWSLLESAPLGRRFVLAGGLTPASVGEAVRRLRPWAVDVSSGVEAAPGRKDPDRVAAFVAAVRAAGRSAA